MPEWDSTPGTYGYYRSDDIIDNDAAGKEWRKGVEGYIETIAGNPNPPSAPRNLTVSSTARGIEIVFNPVNEIGVSEYALYRNLVPHFGDEDTELIQTIHQPADLEQRLRIIDAEGTTNHYYWVRAIKGIRNPKIQGSIAGPEPKPNLPTLVSTELSVPDGLTGRGLLEAVEFDWNDQPTPEKQSNLDAYCVYFQTSPGVTRETADKWILDKKSHWRYTPYTSQGLIDTESTIYVRVSAMDRMGLETELSAEEASAKISGAANPGSGGPPVPDVTIAVSGSYRLITQARKPTQTDPETAVANVKSCTFEIYWAPAGTGAPTAAAGQSHSGQTFIQEFTDYASPYLLERGVASYGYGDYWARAKFTDDADQTSDWGLSSVYLLTEENNTTDDEVVPPWAIVIDQDVASVDIKTMRNILDVGVAAIANADSADRVAIAVRSTPSARVLSNVDQDSASGQTTLYSSAGAAYSAGQEIAIGQGTERFEQHTIASVSPTYLILEDNLRYTHTAAQFDVIKRVANFDAGADPDNDDVFTNTPKEGGFTLFEGHPYLGQLQGMGAWFGGSPVQFSASRRYEMTAAIHNVHGWSRWLVPFDVVLSNVTISDDDDVPELSSFQAWTLKSPPPSGAPDGLGGDQVLFLSTLNPKNSNTIFEIDIEGYPDATPPTETVLLDKTGRTCTVIRGAYEATITGYTPSANEFVGKVLRLGLDLGDNTANNQILEEWEIISHDSGTDPFTVTFKGETDPDRNYPTRNDGAQTNWEIIEAPTRSLMEFFARIPIDVSGARGTYVSYPWKEIIKKKPDNGLRYRSRVHNKHGRGPYTYATDDTTGSTSSGAATLKYCSGVGPGDQDGDGRSQSGGWRETFEFLPKDWNLREGSWDNLTRINAQGKTGGGICRATGKVWLAYNKNIPYDPSKLYRIRCRVRQLSNPTSGTKYINCGVEGVAADGTTLINVAGADSYNSQHYICAANKTPAVGSTWVEYTGWFKGLGTTPAYNASNPTIPSVLRDGTVYFRPLFILNYDNTDGIAEIDYISIDVMDEDSTDRVYKGLDTSGTILNPIGADLLNRGAQVKSITGMTATKPTTALSITISGGTVTYADATSETFNGKTVGSGWTYNDVVWLYKNLGNVNMYESASPVFSDTEVPLGVVVFPSDSSGFPRFKAWFGDSRDIIVADQIVTQSLSAIQAVLGEVETGEVKTNHYLALQKGADLYLISDTGNSNPSLAVFCSSSTGLPEDAVAEAIMYAAQQSIIDPSTGLPGLLHGVSFDPVTDSESFYWLGSSSKRFASFVLNSAVIDLSSYYNSNYESSLTVSSYNTGGGTMLSAVTLLGKSATTTAIQLDLGYIGGGVLSNELRVQIASGGAFQTVFNISNTQITANRKIVTAGNLEVSGTQDIGASGTPWNNIYVNTVWANAIKQGSGTYGQVYVAASGGNYYAEMKGYYNNTYQAVITAIATSSLAQVGFYIGGDIIIEGRTGPALGFFNVTPVSRRTGYTMSNVTEDRTIDANATTTDELADFVCTVVNDLIALGLFGT